MAVSGTKRSAILTSSTTGSSFFTSGDEKLFETSTVGGLRSANVGFGESDFGESFFGKSDFFFWSKFIGSFSFFFAN